MTGHRDCYKDGHMQRASIMCGVGGVRRVGVSYIRSIKIVILSS